MKTGTFRRFLCWVMILAMVMSFAVPAMAADESVVVVDDTVTDSTKDHYFTYTAATDPNGMTGWAADNKTSIHAAGTTNAGGQDVAQTQHWVWNENFEEARKHTYSFTFKGTGVEIVGVKNDAYNAFRLDGGEVQTVEINGAAFTPVVLYSVSGLTYGTHTVEVTLPEGGTGLQVSYANVYGAQTSETQGEELKTTIYHTQTSGDSNYFTYSSTGWAAMGNSPVHVWSDDPSSNPSAIWYEVRFVGHAIDIYAGGNRPMGWVDYYIDDVKMGSYNLYLPSNQDSRFITSFTDLEEGEHVFRAVATGKNGDGGNDLIDCAEVVVYHAPYQVTDVAIAEPSVTISEGASKQIQYTVSPSYAVLENVVYTSADPAVASVSSTGLITGESAGTTQITMTASGFTKTVSVTVKEAVPGIAGSVVDIDTQWTQDRYEEVKSLGNLSENLTAWRNDIATSELALVSVDSALKNVTVTASDFVSSNGTIPADCVTATFIRSTKAYNGGYLGYGNPNRELPAATESNRSESSDILWSTEAMDISYNAVQPVWVEIAVPKDAKPGTYTGTLTVTADGLAEGLTFSYTLTVQDVVLPDAAEYASTFDVELWQYPYSSAEYYGVEPFSAEHLEILRPIMEIYKSVGGHAITTTIMEEAWSGQTYSANDIHYPSMIRWEKVNGTMTYDYTHFDAWVSFCKEMGIGDKIVLYSIAPWHNTITYWENGVLKSENNTLGNIVPDALWTDFLTNLIEHLEEKGWFDDAYIGIDERGFSAAAFDLIESIKNSDGECLKTAGAMDGFVNKWDLALRVTDLNVGDTAAHAHPAEFARLLAERQAKGYRTTLYSCTEHQPGNFSLSAPVESYWIILNAAKMDTAGFLRWAYDAWVADPLNDATHNAFEPGDCFLIYPDEKGSYDGTSVPEAYRSVRLARIAEGVRDINKLMFIEKNAPVLAGDVDAIYEHITSKVVTSRSYLSASGVASLRSQSAAFKAGLNELTDNYVALMAGATTEVESVVITQGDSINVTLGGTAQLTAQVLPENIINDRVVWTSSDANVVTVVNGLLTGKSQGTATVTATSELDPSKSDSIQVTVDLPTVDESKLESYYSFDNVSGTTVYDDWADFDATMQSGATVAAGMSGNALSVNSAGVGAVVDNNRELQDWTVAYWVKTTADLTSEVSVLEDADRKYSLAMRLGSASNRSAAGFRVGDNDGDVLSFTEAGFQKDTWYHIAWTRDYDGNLTLYVNGTNKGTNNWPGLAANRDKIKTPIDVIGGTGFTGLIDEVKIYNAVLTAEEIGIVMQIDGVNLKESYVEIDAGKTYQINATVVSSNTDKSLTYVSADPNVATVNEKGLVTGVGSGTTTITVTNAATGYSAQLTVKVIKTLNIHNVLDRYVMPEDYLSTIERAPGTARQYLGQPDMIQTATGRLIMAYPVGHGKGPLVMRTSDDGGLTWTEKTDIPVSWAGSQETPTLYTVTFKGRERLIMITACPGWGTDSAGYQTGWNVSYSDDDGETWTEYEHFWTNFSNGTANKAIVAMASLIQLKDENGNYIEKWMGVYHNYEMVNFKTYLTFNDDGSMNWTEPVPYLSEYRAIESGHQICEVGLFRSPDGNRIVALARSQSHMNLSTMFWSDDEGETWSEPIDLPGSLAGERHKAMYDSVSGKLLITFREIQYDRDNDGKIESGDWYCGDWGLWVGTYEQLMNLDDGEYCVTIDEDFAQNTYSGDTGYAGFVQLEDGTFVMCSYGHWDEDFSKNWGFGKVTTDLCYIRQARFTLADLEHSMMQKGDHRMGVKWTWSEDLSAATATVGCVIAECDHAETYDAVITSAVDYDKMVVVYTAKVTVDGVEYVDTVEIPYKEPTVTEVELSVGESKTFTDDSGYYADADLSALDTSVATVSITGTAAATDKKLSEAVNTLVSGKQYIIVNTRANKPVTSANATAAAGAGAGSGLLLNGNKDDMAEAAVWTITASGNGYTLQANNGKYMTIGANTANVTDTAAVLTLNYSGNTWTINQDGAYLNHFGGQSSTCAAGWKDATAAGDAGSQWAIYEYTATTTEASTEITITGVGEGTTSVQIGDVVYDITVTDTAHTHTFDQKNTDEKYLASAADCERAATYFFSCSCGEKGTEVFEDGEALGHDYVEGVCTRCGEADPDYVAPKADEVIRLAGSHRWNTAIKVADEMKANLNIEKFDAIIIASGNDFADALAGSYLSTVKNAPILLSWGQGGAFEFLDTDNIEYIKANLAEDGIVYILGGEKAVPGLYEEALKDFTVKRLGGADRFETNLLILEEAGIDDGSEILVCTATNFADSLSASATGKPILLVFNNLTELIGKQPEFLAGLKDCTFTVIGGENAVSAKLAGAISEYGKVERLAGENRFETSVMVAEKYFENPKTAVLAYALNYPDGLCGGSLAFSLKAPLILTMTGFESAAVEYAKTTGITSGLVLGGDALISDASVRTIFAMDAADEIVVK